MSQAMRECSDTPMPKNIVICCDGTGNEVSASSDTNVVKLCRRLRKQDPLQQLNYYDPGLGTLGTRLSHVVHEVFAPPRAGDGLWPRGQHQGRLPVLDAQLRNTTACSSLASAAAAHTPSARFRGCCSASASSKQAMISSPNTPWRCFERVRENRIGPAWPGSRRSFRGLARCISSACGTR